MGRQVSLTVWALVSNRPYYIANFPGASFLYRCKSSKLVSILQQTFAPDSMDSKLWSDEPPVISVRPRTARHCHCHSLRMTPVPLLVDRTLVLFELLRFRWQ